MNHQLSFGNRNILSSHYSLAMAKSKEQDSTLSGVVGGLINLISDTIYATFILEHAHQQFGSSRGSPTPMLIPGWHCKSVKRWG